MTYRLFAVSMTIATTLALTAPATAHAQSYCEEQFKSDESQVDCYNIDPELVPPVVVAPPAPKPDPLQARLIRYARLAMRHKLTGLASYYSASLDGTLTANGERYHAHKLSAAHLTLPLGSWVEITSRATGRKIRLRVNDRGPYVSKFVIDLSEAAARALGVDRAEDRRVDIKLIALPGEDPLPEAVLASAAAGGGTAVADAKATLTTAEK